MKGSIFLYEVSFLSNETLHVFAKGIAREKIVGNQCSKYLGITSERSNLETNFF